jgi:hypothetical protein
LGKGGILTIKDGKVAEDLDNLLLAKQIGTFLSKNKEIN